MGNHDKLPEYIETDVDIVIENKNIRKLDNLLFEIAFRNHLYITSKIWHDRYKIAYILSPSKISKPERVQLDFFSEFASRDFNGSNLYRYKLISANELLINRQKEKSFFIPSSDKGFIFNFI